MCARSDKLPGALLLCRSTLPLRTFSPVKKSGWPYPPSSRRNCHMAERLIVFCVAMIAELFGMVIEATLVNAKTVCDTGHELCARKPSALNDAARSVLLAAIAGRRGSRGSIAPIAGGKLMG